MRILYCTDTYPPQVNGVSVVTALSVSGLHARGWSCAVVAPRYPAGPDTVFTETSTGAEDLLASIPSVRLPLYPDLRLSAPAYATVSAVVRRFRPDLIHSETEFVLGRLGQIAGRRAGIPLVSSYHTDFARYAAAYGAPWLRAGVAAYIARFHRRSERTYTPSGPARSDLLRTGVTDVEVWGRGVDAVTYNPSHRSAAWRDRLALGDRVAFLYVGRLAAEKRVEQIVDAYTAALERLPPDSTRLIIAGAGPRESAIRASAPAGTVMLGYLDRRTDLPALYASADAFVFASLTETLGLVVLEAMASGLPVIAVPAGGVADHLRDDVNGVAVPEADTGAMAAAMVALATDAQRRRRLSAGARATAEGLTWDAELDRLDASYRQVCARAVARTPSAGGRARPTPEPRDGASSAAP
jgi:glycosyltransferase involved in cell wall biosynthesis